MDEREQLANLLRKMKANLESWRDPEHTEMLKRAAEAMISSVIDEVVGPRDSFESPEGVRQSIRDYAKILLRFERNDEEDPAAP